MLRSTKLLTTAGCLLALALVSSPNAAQAKGARASGQAKAAGATATKTKTIIPSKLLMVKGKSNKTQKFVASKTKTPASKQKYCHLPRRPYDCGYLNIVYYGDGCDDSEVSANDDSSDQSATEAKDAVDDTATAVADAN